MNQIISYSKSLVSFSALLLAVSLAGCWGGGSSGTSAPPDTPPTVLSSTPANLTSGAPLNVSISATFSEALNPASVSTSTFTVTGPGGAVGGTVTYSGVTAIFMQSANLAINTTYTVTISGVKDLAGNGLATNYVTTFTTGTTVDTSPPSVSLSVPLNGAVNVAFNTGIAVTFTSNMDPATINANTFTLTGPGTTAVAGTVSYTGVTAIFTPAANLAANTTYTGTITSGAKDLAGNALNPAFVWSFTTAPTGTALNTTAPAVSLTDPLNSAVNVVLNKKISATFTTPMNPSTINSTTFTLHVASGNVLVAGTVNFVGQTATFTPAANLLVNTPYIATITSGAHDLSGNALAANFSWVFTSGSTIDSTPPKVTATDPPTANQNIPTNKILTAAFDESMDPATITTATFTLMQGTTPIAGTVTYVGLTATFTPLANLAPGTSYVATITTGAADLAGNKLSANYTWGFITGAGPAATPPTVTLTAPANLAVSVCPSALISATFSEAMNPTTINASTFVLAAGTTGVAGVVSYNPANMVATFTPSAALATSTSYTATVTTGVHDATGNALAANKAWTFTTAAAACGGTQAGPVSLGAASTFGSFGGSGGMANQGVLTVINGDIGTTAASTAVTGFNDAGAGCVYTETPLNVGKVNGNIYTAAPPPTVTCPSEGTAATAAIAAQAALAAQTAYNNLLPAAIPGGTDPGSGQLGGLTLAPGTYKSTSGAFLITGSDLTLDGKGDAGAVFVFQMATSLTVGAAGAPRNIVLINGAQAKNVFWQVGSSATINAAGGGNMIGTIIASAGVSFSTAGNAATVILNGRAMSLNASVTMVNTIINVPGP
jgi:ice-binding like protein/Big-like domain-containing protein